MDDRAGQVQVFICTARRELSDHGLRCANSNCIMDVHSAPYPCTLFFSFGDLHLAAGCFAGRGETRTIPRTVLLYAGIARSLEQQEMSHPWSQLHYGMPYL